MTTLTTRQLHDIRRACFETIGDESIPPEDKLPTVVGIVAAKLVLCHPELTLVDIATRCTTDIVDAMTRRQRRRDRLVQRQHDLGNEPRKCWTLPGRGVWRMSLVFPHWRPEQFGRSSRRVFAHKVSGMATLAAEPVKEAA